MKTKKYIMSSEELENAKNLTANTLVLLKNKKNTLPLNKGSEKIALIGPYADNIAILGSWSMFSDKSKVRTLKEVFEQRRQNQNILYAKGSEILEEEEINKILLADGDELIHTQNEEERTKEYIKEAIEIAKKSEIIVLAMGEHYKQSGEACSRANIEISKIQLNLLNELSKLNKKIIAIIFSGRPLVLKSVEEKVDALLEVWFPGTCRCRGNSRCYFWRCKSFS